MKAVRILRPGGPDGLEIAEIPDPERPRADRVLVRVRAAALNRADILQREGRYPPPPGYPLDIPGLEFAGEVAAVGDEVRQWREGQRVFGIIGGGAQAEYLIAPADHLAEVPTKLSWVEAAAVPEAFITAHDALFTQAKFQLGENVLIHAAGSGVGTAAIQLMRSVGGKAFGTARTAEKLERASSLGLSGSVKVGEDPSVFVEKILEWTGGTGVDVVLDLVGARYLLANLTSLATNGRMVLLSTASGAKSQIDLGVVLRKRLRIMGSVLRSRSLEEKARATRLFAKHVLPLLAVGTIQPVIDSTYTLSEIRLAHERLESNETFGKVVVVIRE